MNDKEKIDKTLEVIKIAMDYLEKKRLEHENLDAQGKAKLYAGIVFPSYFDSQKELLEQLKGILSGFFIMAKLPLNFPLKWIIIGVCLIFSGLLFTNEKIMTAWSKFWLWSGFLYFLTFLFFMIPVLCKECGKPLKPNRKMQRLCSDCEVAEGVNY